jgi:sugar O-acyltransferase (sialic acid O-acetyltransferase NeuD family)
LGFQTEILVIGSSGHGGVIIDILEACGHRIAGYLDDAVPAGVIKRGYPILGRLADFDEVCEQRKLRDIVLAIGDNWWRRKVCNDIKMGSDVRYPLIVHPTASIARSAQVAEGSVLMAHANVGAHASLGKFTIINSGASLDHDCVLGAFASLAPGVFTGGFVEIGECSAVGVGATISDRVKIGSHSVVGTGAVVVRDIPDLTVAYGNPARVKRQRTEGEPYDGSVRIHIG